MTLNRDETNRHFQKYENNRDVISLFSGAMGLDIGLGEAGLNVVIGQDFEPTCVETMRANGHKVLGGDIRAIQPEDILDLVGLQVGEPFLICGGPPCQPFSTAGKQWICSVNLDTGDLTNYGRVNEDEKVDTTLFSVNNSSFGINGNVRIDGVYQNKIYMHYYYVNDEDCLSTEGIKGGMFIKILTSKTAQTTAERRKRAKGS